MTNPWERDWSQASSVPAGPKNPWERDWTGLRADAPEQPEGNDFGRGLRTSMGQLAPLAKGAVGLLGATAENLLGEGGVATGVKNWGLRGFQEGMAKLQPLQRDTDELTTAWERAKNGEFGALVDWAQYGLGYSLGQIGESAAVAVLGGVVGGATAGPVGAAGGAAGGTVAKGGVKALARDLIEGQVQKEAERLVLAKAVQEGTQLTAEQLAKQAAEQVVRQAATRNVAKAIGSGTALGAFGVMQSAGSIYPEAVERARAEGRELDGGDLARVWGASLAAGGVEALTDKLGLDVAAGRIKLPGTGGRAARGAAGLALGAAAEGGTEAAQTAIERYGAGKALTGDEATAEYINAAGLGAIGGGAVGGLSSALRSPEAQDAQARLRAEIARMRASTQAAQAAPAQTAAAVMSATTVDEAIQKANEALGKRNAYLESQFYDQANEARGAAMAATLDAQMTTERQAFNRGAGSVAQGAQVDPITSQLQIAQQADRGMVGPPRRPGQGAPAVGPAGRGRATGSVARSPERPVVGPSRAPAVPLGSPTPPMEGPPKPARPTLPSRPTAPATGVDKQPVSVSRLPSDRRDPRAGPYVDLTPMTAAQAQQRLATIRQEAQARGEDPARYAAVQHPGQKFMPVSQGQQGNRQAGPRLPAFAIVDQQARKLPTPEGPPRPGPSGAKREQPKQLPEPVEAFIARLRETATPAAREFVRMYDKGELSREDVLRAMVNERRMQRSPSQRAVQGAGLVAPGEQPSGDTRPPETPDITQERGLSWASQTSNRDNPDTGAFNPYLRGRGMPDIQPPKAVTAPAPPPAPGAPAPAPTSVNDADWPMQPKLQSNRHNAELEKAVQEALRTKSGPKGIRGVLKVLATSNNPVIKYLGEHLGKGIHPDYKIVPFKGHGANTYGVHYRLPTGHLMYQPRNPGKGFEGHEDSEHTVAHELVHALTVNNYHAPQTKEQREAKKELQVLAQKARDLMRKERDPATVKLGRPTIWYGTAGDNIDTLCKEFIAEAFSNSYFQERLAREPYGDMTLWTKFVKAIAKILGLDKPSMLTEALRLGEALSMKPSGKAEARATRRVARRANRFLPVTPEYSAGDGQAQETPSDPGSGRGNRGRVDSAARAEGDGTTAREDGAAYDAPGPTEPFYSELARALEGLTTKTAPAEGWKQAIKGLVAKGVVQADEVEWTGVNEWLDLQAEGAKAAAQVAAAEGPDSDFTKLWQFANPSKITREQVLQYLRDNGVQIEEVELGNEREAPRTPEEQSEWDAYEAHERLAETFRISVGELDYDPETDTQEMGVFIEDKFGDPIDEDILTPEQGRDLSTVRAFYAAGRGIPSFRPERRMEGRPAKFSTYRAGDSSTAKPNSYRELLLRLAPRGLQKPPQDPKELFTALERRIQEVLDERLRTNRISEPQHRNFSKRLWFQLETLRPDELWGYDHRDFTIFHPAEDGGQGRARLDPNARPQGPRLGFSSSHWDETDVLAHVRLDERRDADGKRVLFVNEIQSDWAQRGRSMGFRGPEPVSAQKLRELEDEFEAAKSYLALRRQDEEVWYEAAKKASDEDAETAQARWERAQEEKHRAALRVDAAAVALGEARAANMKNAGGTPRGPFVEKTDAWVALAVKRLIKYAADNGFDRVALPTGDQMVEQFRLSDQVDTVMYYPQDKRVVATKDGSDVASRYVDTPEELADVIGKGLAEDMLQQYERRLAMEAEARAQYPVEQDKEGAYQRWRVRGPDGEFLQFDDGALANFSTEEQAIDYRELQLLRAGKVMDPDAPVTREGLDLDIGGDGQREFYDKIVPKVAARIAKKLGAGPLETVDVGRELKRDLYVEKTNPVTWQIHDRKNDKWLAANHQWVDSPVDAWEFRDELLASRQADKHQDMPSLASQQTIRITPALRQAVARGAPLFMREPGNSARPGASATLTSTPAQSARPRPTKLIELRKRAAVLRRLQECLAA